MALQHLTGPILHSGPSVTSITVSGNNHGLDPLLLTKMKPYFVFMQTLHETLQCSHYSIQNLFLLSKSSSQYGYKHTNQILSYFLISDASETIYVVEPGVTD